MKRDTFSQKVFKSMSKRWLSLCEEEFGPTTMGLKHKSEGLQHVTQTLFKFFLFR